MRRCGWVGEGFPEEEVLSWVWEDAEEFVRETRSWRGSEERARSRALCCGASESSSAGWLERTWHVAGVAGEQGEASSVRGRRSRAERALLCQVRGSGSSPGSSHRSHGRGTVLSSGWAAACRLGRSVSRRVPLGTPRGGAPAAHRQLWERAAVTSAPSMRTAVGAEDGLGG